MNESAGEIHETQEYEIPHLSASQLLPNDKFASSPAGRKEIWIGSKEDIEEDNFLIP